MDLFPNNSYFFNKILIIYCYCIVIVSSSDLSKLSAVSAAFGGGTFGVNNDHHHRTNTVSNSASSATTAPPTYDKRRRTNRDSSFNDESNDYEVLDKNIINDFFSDNGLLWNNDDDDDLGDIDRDIDELRNWNDSGWLDDDNDGHSLFNDSIDDKYSRKNKYSKKRGSSPSDDEFVDSNMGRINELQDDDENWSEEYGPTSEKGQLYEAYNLLHRLAQDFEKPFDAPAVLVVGHQSSGKSALIEALIGFQYNQVGGGTKTRRPIALRMQYNPRYSKPRCYLKDEETGEEVEKSLEDIKRYVEAENNRLEQSPMKSFDSREIHIRMEYKYCPNMILIDTPGLISAPRAKKANARHRALISQAREVESLVLSKIACEDYIIVCVEDTNDWKHGVTRQVVQKVDVDLSRTVIVNTKLDTKIPQFTSNSDVASFLTAEIVDEISPFKLAGPFFTSVPAGRVGMGRDDSFRSNSEFVSACKDVEERDRSIVEKRLSKLRSASDRNDLLDRVGMNKLREYLEHKVDERYRSNVQRMIPLLKAEHDTTKRKLEGVTQELHFLNQDNLKSSAYSYCDDFTSALRDAIQGSIVAPSSEFGQSLDKEHTLLGSFHDAPNCHMAIPSSSYHQFLHHEVGQIQHRLYGGSAYHRVIREFDFASRCLRLPAITPDEIANAAGMGENHDGVDLLRASCIISLDKAKLTFDPLVVALNSRLKHVMVQLFPVVDYIVGHKYDQRKKNSYTDNNSPGMDISHSPLFKQWIHDVFNKFVHQCSDSAMSRCHDDITALTRFITWDIKDSAGPAMLARSLPDDTDAVGIYKVAVESANKGADNETTNKKNDKSRRSKKNSPNKEESVGKDLVASNSSGDNNISTEQYTDLVHLMEEQYSGMLTRNDPDRTDTLISHLVQHIVSQWRINFCKSTIQKINCYFLMPFLDEFSKYIRMQLDNVDMDEFLELSYMKNKLVKKREDLLRESKQNEILQEKFSNLQKTMATMGSSTSSKSDDTKQDHYQDNDNVFTSVMSEMNHDDLYSEIKKKALKR